MTKDDLRDASVPIAARLHLIKAFRGAEEAACGDALERDIPRPPKRDPPPGASAGGRKEEEAEET